MSKWFVSRQCYWGVEEPYVVEIAGGGLDYANPDMIVEKYPGEGKEYTDPREAVGAALSIAEAWKKDDPDLTIGVACGYTGGNTLPFEPGSAKELKAWAEKVYADLPRCIQCGEVLGEGRFLDVESEPTLCSERCAEAHHAFEDEDEEKEDADTCTTL